MKTTKDEFSINWLTPEKDIVKEPSELEEKAAELVNEIIEYAYEYRTNIQTNQTWVFRKYKVSEMTDLEIKRCLNSMKIATERMPKDKAITKLKTVIDLYEGKFKW